MTWRRRADVDGARRRRRHEHVAQVVEPNAQTANRRSASSQCSWFGPLRIVSPSSSSPAGLLRRMRSMIVAVWKVSGINGRILDGAAELLDEPRFGGSVSRC